MIERDLAGVTWSWYLTTGMMLNEPDEDGEPLELTSISGRSVGVGLFCMKPVGVRYNRK